MNAWINVSHSTTCRKNIDEIRWVRAKDLRRNAQFSLDSKGNPKPPLAQLNENTYKEYFQVTDLNQGCVGNCWLLAAAAGIVQNYQLFKRVVPFDNSFNDTEYTGKERGVSFRWVVQLFTKKYQHLEIVLLFLSLYETKALSIFVYGFMVRGRTWWSTTICQWAPITNCSSVAISCKTTSSGVVCWRRHMPRCKVRMRPLVEVARPTRKTNNT